MKEYLRKLKVMLKDVQTTLEGNKTDIYKKDENGESHYVGFKYNTDSFTKSKLLQRDKISRKIRKVKKSHRK